MPVGRMRTKERRVAEMRRKTNKERMRLVKASGCEKHKKQPSLVNYVL